MSRVQKLDSREKPVQSHFALPGNVSVGFTTGCQFCSDISAFENLLMLNYFRGVHGSKNVEESFQWGTRMVFASALQSGSTHSQAHIGSLKLMKQLMK